MDDVRAPIDIRSTRFMDRLRLFIRSRHLAYHTEKTYCHWVLGYIRFSGRRHPEEMGEAEIEAYLQYLSTVRNVSPNTQKVALNALFFFIKSFCSVNSANCSLPMQPSHGRFPRCLVTTKPPACCGNCKVPPG